MGRRVNTFDGRSSLSLSVYVLFKFQMHLFSMHQHLPDAELIVHARSVVCVAHGGATSAQSYDSEMFIRTLF